MLHSTETTSNGRAVCPRFEDRATGKYKPVAIFSALLACFAITGLARFFWITLCSNRTIRCSRFWIPFGHSLSLIYGCANVYYIYKMKDLADPNIRFLQGFSTCFAWFNLLYAFEARENEYASFVNTMQKMRPEVSKLLVSTAPL
eukprot:UN28431